MIVVGFFASSATEKAAEQQQLDKRILHVWAAHDIATNWTEKIQVYIQCVIEALEPMYCEECWWLDCVHFLVGSPARRLG